VSSSIAQKVDTQARVIRSLNLIHCADTRHMVGAVELERLLNLEVENLELKRRIKRLEEFVDQLTNPKFTRDDLPKEALLQRIKRLEEAGDALKASGYFGGFGDAVNKWIKVREDKR